MANNYDDMLSRFHLIPKLYGQTDGHICYINIARYGFLFAFYSNYGPICSSL